MCKLTCVISLAALLTFPLLAHAEQLHRADHAVVRYTGIEPDQAKAVAGVVETSRQLAVDRYSFGMPETITVTIDVAPRNKVRLFTDGNDRLNLSLRSADQLRPPEESGIFNLYGMCHELGHIAMYRAIPQHGWLNTAGAEGWAHYLGSELTDGVFDTLGESGWCYPYDYKQDGTARLNQQLAAEKPSDTARAAGLWRDLVSLIGEDNIAPLFKAWGEAEVDPTDPSPALRRVVIDLHDDPAVADWWNRFEPLMIRVQPRSDFTARTAKPTELLRQPTELAHDDGQPKAKRSIAGGGHAVAYEAPGPGWYLTQVRIYGSRYGQPRPPAEDFSVWLCDAEGQVAREFKFPYKTFTRGNPKWVALRVEPTEVPTDFIVCVGFNPTGTKGVFVHHDDAADGGGSYSGLPGNLGEPMARGNWLIRAVIDQHEEADALREPKS